MLEDNSEEEQQPCIICNQHHEQMLMLSCVHDPCINCAAKHYVQTEPQDSNIYTCSKCGQETELDESSIKELRRIYNQNKRRRKLEGRSTTQSTSKGSPLAEHVNRRNQPQEPPQDARRKDREPTDYSHPHKKTAPAQVTYPSNPKKTSPVLQYSCEDHQQQQLTYFCFSCTRPICPECAIHGLHKDHQVETTRKAIKQIKGLLAEDKQKLEAETKNLFQLRDKGKKQTKLLADQNRSDQDYIKKKITHLRNVLTQKQKQLLKAAEANFDKNIERIKQEDSLGDKTLAEITNINRSIESTLKKQDLAILQEYNKRDEEVNAFLEKAEINKDKLIDYQEKNPHKAINLALLDQDMDRLLTEIYGFKLTTIIAKQTYNC